MIGVLRRRVAWGLIGLGDQYRFHLRVVRGVLGGRVLRYSSEVRRQAFRLALTTGSVMLVVGMAFGFGLVIGIQSVYGARLVGAPSLAGAGTAVANLREVTPYAFAYMMAAKVSTGYVAEIGTMRIADEIDALDVMGFDSMVYLGSTRLLGSWLVLPFVYATAILLAFVASFLVVVVQIGQISAGAYLELFWKYQSASDFGYSMIKGMTMGTFVVLVGCFYGYRVGGGPVQVGQATARAMVANLIGIHLIGIVTSQLFWGSSPGFPVGG
jgi:phospholipid/cholesterol/gamma-HCH transport system permease protein